MLSLRLGLNKWQRREPPFRNLPRSRESERTFHDNLGEETAKGKKNGVGVGSGRMKLPEASVNTSDISQTKGKEPRGREMGVPGEVSRQKE